jgi:Lsr2
VAKRTIHVLVDDLDGGEAEETVKFSIDGIQYEIDLSKKNANKMREALAPYISAGTKVGRGGVLAGGRSASRARAGGDRDQNRAIREWAQSKGIKVSDRGRIKQEIVDRYNAEAGR